MQELKQSIIDKAINGDQDAFERLYRYYLQPIYAFVALRIGARQDVEDVTQQIFIKVLKNIKKFNGLSSLTTWIYKIAYHCVVDFYRKRKIELPIDENKIVFLDDLEKTNMSLQEEKINKVNKILTKLPKNYAEVIKLRFLQNQSIKETANILGISENNVKVRQFRALQKASNLNI